MERQQRLLRNYIKILLEDGSDSTGTYAFGGYTVYTDTKGLEDIFFAPIKNIFKVAEGETKKLFSSTKLAARVVKAVLKNFIPGLKAKFDAAFNAHKSEIKEIESKYKQFYDATFAVLNDSDVKIAAFLWNPGLFMAGKVLMNSGGTTKSVSDLLKSTGDVFKTKDSESEKEKEDFERYGSFRRQQREKLASSQKIDDKKNQTISVKQITNDSTTESMLIRNLIGSVLLEKKFSNDIFSISDSYKKKFKTGLSNLTNELGELKNMDDISFIKKYASSLGDTQKLYRQVEEQLKNVKGSKNEPGNENVKLAVKEIESKKKEIISSAKQSLKNAYIQVLEGQKKEIEKNLSELSKAWKIKIDPSKHGQISELDNELEVIKKIEI